jgi:hypothetical protein
MNYEVERIWKEEVVVSFDVLFLAFAQKAQAFWENNKTLGRMFSILGKIWTWQH